jgi:hypothetical protein
MSKLYQDAEQFIKDMYWADTHDRSCTFNVREHVNERLLEDNRQKDPEYYGKREGVVHVSSLSKCLRGVAHEMLGMEKTAEIEPRKLGVFKAGNLFEDYVVSSLGDRVKDRQTEYLYQYKGITLTGRDDGTVTLDKDRVLEVKSVHSDSFWYREKEGTLVAWNNQIQLQTYLWLRRELYGQQIDGYFVYISKDDCTVSGAPVRYNPKFIEHIVKPALDYLAEAYEKKDVNGIPLPDTVIWNESRKMYQKNWLCTYCDYHEHCAGPNWVVEAEREVKEKNKAYKETAKK